MADSFVWTVLHEGLGGSSLPSLIFFGIVGESVKLRKRRFGAFKARTGEKCMFYIELVSVIVGSTEAPSKVFILFFLLPDWLKLNHLKSRLECGFSDIFSRHFCSTVAGTIGVTINPTGFGAKQCSENHI